MHPLLAGRTLNVCIIQEIMFGMQLSWKLFQRISSFWIYKYKYPKSGTELWLTVMLPENLAGIKFGEMTVFWYWRNLNLASNCTYDVISFMLWDTHCTFSACKAYASSLNVWIVNGLWGRKLYSRLPCFQKCLELNHRGRIELRARKDKHQESLCCAVIRRSAVVGPVPPKILAACALFLRRNHLRLVLFNTRVQSCHEEFGCARVCNVRVGGTHYAYVMFI